MRKMRTAVVGCGAISDIYLHNMIHMFENLEVTACCANHYENAVKKAAQYGIRACTYEEILADDSVELVVILTPAPTHYELIRKALLAGKHVYTEKTLAVTVEEAEELLRLADEKKVYLGAAPDTFLGASIQKARQMIEEGKLGEITSFQICANRNLDFLAGMFKFLRLPGGGICQDYGVYYLTALVSLLGPVDSVAAVVTNRAEVRKSAEGEEYRYPNESQVTAILQLENGIAGSFSLNGDSILEDQAVFTVYGKEGLLKLGDPNQFGSELRYVPGSRDWSSKTAELPVKNDLPYKENCRGLGPSEMADAIFHNRRNKANKELAFHVLDVIGQIQRSGKTRQFEKVGSTYWPSAPNQ